MSTLLIDKSGVGDATPAEPFCLAGLQNDPMRADLTYLMGLIKMQKGDFEAAASYFLRTTMIEPNNVRAFCNLGAANAMMRKEFLALQAYNRALGLDPNHYETLNNRGLLLRETGNHDQALVDWDRCLQVDDRDPIIYNNRGLAFQSLCRIEEALSSYMKSCEIAPDYAQSWQNLAMCQILAGDYEHGWKNYEWRWLNDAFTSPRRDFDADRWDGNFDLNGLTLLVHAEQGLGDTIQFSRYLPDLIGRIAGRGEVVVEVQGSLVGLVQSMLPGVRVVANGDTLPAFDLHCPMLSLPLMFDTRADTIPSKVPYLMADPVLIESWEKKLPKNDRPRVGIVWSGGTAHFNDRNRSLALAELLKHLPEGFDYISLQKEVRPHDRATLRGRPDILHVGDELESFSDTAALCSLVDHVISVDTSVAHLAGALGRPTSLLLPFSPDWRWMMDREDTPWYPTMRLCRQEKAGDWDSSLAKLTFEEITRE